MSFYTPSNNSLNDVMRMIRWDDFKYVVQSTKDIAAEVRKDNRRKQREFSTCLMITPIKEILDPISRMFNYRCSDDSLFYLISQAVCKIGTLVRELREYAELKYVSRLEEVSSILVSFIGKNQGIQLELFDSQEYFDPNGAKRKLPCFIRWYNGILREISLHFRDKSKKVGFSNPYKNCGKIPHMQLSIPFGRAKAEAAKKLYMAAYFDVSPEADTTISKEEKPPVDLAGLGLRTLRKVAKSLGVAQKVDGKDRTKASFVEVLSGLFQTERERVTEALAAVG
ncbi:hypothetical protein I4641_13900 [Waterburya agarophytonicola K14]|uniref:Uncharacterized protein n=1 Tax=Waterburya agarophytonicola KI4 TaxID=2874699 RepID=A0A964BRW6_9CYAN|nr:hypothetical protein [Waterburya agarophytonicola]MCC0178074.1 hypothetical protein [Waterburya agarophytonicola KI4]